MSQISLNCLVYGDEPALSHIFAIEISHTAQIIHLRSNIWGLKKARHLARDPLLTADDFILYTPVLPISTKKSESLFSDIVSRHSPFTEEGLKGLKKLNPTFTLEDYGFSRSINPKELHILIAVTTQTGDQDSDGKRKLAGIPSNYLTFHRQFWGVPLDSTLTTLPNDAFAMDLDDVSESSEEDDDSKGDVLPGEPFLTVGEQLLVRAEYIRVFDAVKSKHEAAHDTRFVVVTGQPGIGKSLWILYALRRCLGEKQQVVLYELGKCILFSESGVDIIDPINYQSGGKYTWCFVDSTDAIDTLPASICRRSVQLFPIYVTSPKQSRWSSIQQFRILPAVIIMNPWKWQEIKMASRLYPNRDPADIRARFYDAGPSAAICLEYDSDGIENFYRKRDNLVKRVTLNLFTSLVNDTESLSMDEFSHTICTVYRQRFNDILGPYVVEPSTLFVRRLLLTQLRDLKEQEFSDLMEQFSRLPSAHGMTGVLFEAYSHRVFAKQIELMATPMFRTKDARSRWHATFSDFSKNPKLQKARFNVSHNINSNISLRIAPTKTIIYSQKLVIEEDVYYLPRAENEVAVDALILHDNYLYLFQSTISPIHDINFKIEYLSHQFSGLPPRHNWRFIFIVPEGLDSFSCLHSNHGFLQDHIPYTAKIIVSKKST